MRELHVAIAVLCKTVGGPATYGRRLVQALAQRAGFRLSVLTDAPESFAFAGVDVVPLPMRGGIDRLRWQYVALPRALKKLGPDVFHDTKNALPRSLRQPACVTVHDLAYHTVPESFGFWSRSFLRWATRDAVRRAAAIVVPSQATANDLQRFHPGSRDRVHVVPHGIDPMPELAPETVAAARHKLGLPERFVLHVGTVQARKNVDLVVDGVRALRDRGFPHHVVLVGRRGWMCERALRSIAADDHTLWIEHVDAKDLPSVYAAAEAFVSPSAYEGFGFAVADALAAGVPTVVSNVSSLPELCGEGAVRLRELSATAVADALAVVLGDPIRTQARVALGRERAAQFTWEAAADGHLRTWFAVRRGS
ncbi:MAG: glycosyltransferase family 4 protein [Planctomycetes bacterium]|nr:glycosyltransferase family 4 protein [Planctomycetota bacterium]